MTGGAVAVTGADGYLAEGLKMDILVDPTHVFEKWRDHTVLSNV